jgi:hypothetical protein
MAKKRELELHMLRFLPHPLRDDFITVGLLLLESGGGFAELRFTDDWSVLQCIAPGIETEWFQSVEHEIRVRLGSLRKREDLMQLVNEKFGTVIDVSPTKAVQAENPAEEMAVLTSMYLVPARRGLEPCEERSGIVNVVKDEFAKVGVLGVIQRDVAIERYTMPGDPFRFDFGYRTGPEVKIIHAVSITANVDPVLALLYRYPIISAGMQQEGLKACLTAVVDERAVLEKEAAQFAIGLLSKHAIRVEPLDNIGTIAEQVHRDVLIGKLDGLFGTCPTA